MIIAQLGNQAIIPWAKLTLQSAVGIEPPYPPPR